MADPGTFGEFYRSDFQSVWSLLVAPALFLLWRAWAHPPAHGGAAPEAAGFVAWWCTLFALETLIDPIATGPFVRALGVDGEPAGTAVMVLFVLLGDFRMLWLVLALARPERAPARAAGPAALLTLAVPAVALAYEGLRRAALPGVDPNSIWLVYELAFLALALLLRARLVPARVGPERPGLRGVLRAVLGWVGVYYALWATSDVLIQLGGLDAGWALRVVPNQLYYAFSVPFVWLVFFSRRYAASSTSVQVSR